MWSREHKWRRAAKAHRLDFGICWAKMKESELGLDLKQKNKKNTLAAVLSIDYRGPRAKPRD